tara:strand:+ start:2532 stop:3893 length:1362 start_codon:yes stop_codon:yes gene_type:complete
MNILSIYTSHDGCITYVEDNKIIFHTQLDRYNRFKYYTFPVKEIIKKIEKLPIDKILISSSENNSMGIWEDLINNSKKLRNINIHFYNDKHHHLFHAYCALTWNKNIENILVCDGTGALVVNAGDMERESQYIFKDNELKHITTEFNKIGLDYEIFTALTFEHPSACGKTMAFSLHDKGSKKTQEDYEKSMTDLITKWDIKDSLLFTGGCAQNILYNSKLIPKFKNIFCDPFNGDFGLSLGAANYFLENKIRNDTVYLGIPQDLDISIFCNYNILDTDTEEVAKILLEDPVAIFQSRSEQGQRGLGNRSLLMSPLHKNSQEKLNKIKKREWFRPFACSILKEKTKEWFDMTIDESPYMMYVFDLKKEKEGILKAGLAVDNKSRIQTVDKDRNLNYYNLIKSFEKLTGVPILINTSLNLPGEVLVETMNDLKELFETSELDYIYLPEINKLIKK